MNMLDNQIEDPKLSITLNHKEDEKCSILIKDNGTGLTEEKFEEMTSYHFFQSSFVLFGISTQFL